MTHRHQGQHWERAAESFLNQRGLKTLERNFHSRFGEIDIVMRDGDYLVFVEVKYRRSQRHGGGVHSVDFRKRQKLVSTARCYLACNPQRAEWPCRFDVVAIEGNGEQHAMEWIRDAFPAH